MSREKLPDRRPSQTYKIRVLLDGSEHKLLVTVGFRDLVMTQPYEVFCSSFKTGFSLNSIVSDSCVLLSRLLQYGNTPEELAGALSQPPSLIGEITRLIFEISRSAESDGPSPVVVGSGSAGAEARPPSQVDNPDREEKG